MINRNPINSLAYVLNIFAILTLLVLLAIYFGVGFLPENFQSIKNLVQSLISDISAVLVIFLVVGFFLDRKGLSPSSIFKEDLISDLLKRYPSTRNFLNSSEANTQFDIVERLKTAKEVYLTGWSLTLIQKISPNLIEAALNGTKIKVIITEPKSSISQTFLSHQIDNNIENDLELVIKVLAKIKSEISDKVKAELPNPIEVRYSSWIPSCSVMFVNPLTENGVLRLMVYPMSIKTNHSSIETFKIIYKNQEAKVFDYFLNEFNSLWNEDTITEVEYQQKQQKKELDNVSTLERAKLRQMYDIRTVIPKSKTIDIVGYSSKSIVEDCRIEIVNSVLAGSEVRLVVVEPNSQASQLIMANSKLKLFEADIINTKTRSEAIIKEIEEKSKNLKHGGKFEIRFMNWVPSYTIFLSDRNEETGSLKLTVNHLTYFTQYKEPAFRNLIYKSKDPTGFLYICDQFEKIWEVSKPLNQLE